MRGGWVVTGHFGHKEPQEEACRRHCWRKQCVGRRGGLQLHHTHHTCAHTPHMCTHAQTPHMCTIAHTSHMCTYHIRAHTPQCSYTTHMLTHSIYVHINHTCSQVFAHITHTHTLIHSTHAHALSGTNCITRSPTLDSGGLPPAPALRSSLQLEQGELRSFKSR